MGVIIRLDLAVGKFLSLGLEVPDDDDRRGVLLGRAARAERELGLRPEQLGSGVAAAVSAVARSHEQAAEVAGGAQAC